MDRIKLIAAAIALVILLAAIGYIAYLRHDLQQTEIARDQFKKAAETNFNYIRNYEAEKQAYEQKNQQLLSLVDNIPTDKCSVPVSVRSIIGKL